jgi:hypothetical protein
MLFPEDYGEASLFPNAASQNRSQRSYPAKVNSICGDDLLNSGANFRLKSSMFLAKPHHGHHCRNLVMETSLASDGDFAGSASPDVSCLTLSRYPHPRIVNKNIMTYFLQRRGLEGGNSEYLPIARRVLVAIVLPTGAPIKLKPHHYRETTHRRGRSRHRENRVKLNRVHSDSPPASSAITAANCF